MSGSQSERVAPFRKFTDRIPEMMLRFLISPGFVLFATLMASYGYFYQGGSSGVNTRFDLARSIVETGSPSIDAYHHNSIDKARVGAHYYSDKAPGVSWLAVPVYAALEAASPEGHDRAYLDHALYLSTLFAVAIPSALAGVAFYTVAGWLGLSRTGSAFVALAYGLCTLAFPYSTLFFGQQLAAALLFLGFAVLMGLRYSEINASSKTSLAIWLSLAGLLLGYAVAVEYSAALAAGIMGLYVFLVRPGQRLFCTFWFAVGLSLPAIALATYHAAVFGGSFVLPYHFSTRPYRHLGFFMGIGSLDLNVLWNLLFSGYRGLFYGAPWLLMSVPGGVLLWRGGYRVEVALLFSIFFLFVFFNASLVDWEGGWGMGPRYMIPALPFLALLSAGTWRWLAALKDKTGKAFLCRITVIVAIELSLMNMLAGTAVAPRVSDQVSNPYLNYIYPLFFSGNLAIRGGPV